MLAAPSKMHLRYVQLQIDNLNDVNRRLVNINALDLLSTPGNAEHSLRSSRTLYR
jgi:hypothetical protein